MASIKGKYNGIDRDIEATEDGELIVRAISESEAEHASSKGNLYSWVSANTDIDAGDTILFVKNTSDKFLIVSHLEVDIANVICTYNVGIGTETTTATGTVITAVNWNSKFAGTTESYLAYHDETAVADATIMYTLTCPITNSIERRLDGIILGKNHYIQINQETESTSGRVALVGHFESEAV